ncbi:MAG TPA: site-specific integrase [Ktedonobacteraceae bacterium]|nr:site-specific integrase [Ktedonobacteraceae bacterium]
MARRGHGEGSIYQRKDGRWVAAVTLENRKRKTFYGETRKEVQNKLKAALHEQQQGTLLTGPEQTFGVYLPHWIEQVVKLTKRPNTYNAYRSVVNYHLIPAFGYIKLRKLTVEQVQAFFAQKQETLNPKTLALIRAALSSALENAVKWGLVGRNVASFVVLPSIERYEGQVLTIVQARKLLDVARDFCLDALLLVALTTGMRSGELFALHWNDIDFETGLLHVRRNLARMNGVGLIEKEPKSKAGRRKFTLPHVVLEVLKEHQEKQQRARMKAGEKWEEKGLVFANTYGRYYNAANVRVRFKRLLKKADLPDVRFHDLRHSVATLLLVAKVDLKVVSELLGHSSVAITADIYQSVLPEQWREVVDKMDDLFKRP